MSGLSPHLRKSAPREDGWREKRYREITIPARADSETSKSRSEKRRGGDNDDNGWRLRENVNSEKLRTKVRG